MSEYTREEILKMIEDVGGPENLDLSGKDLSEIDLSAEAIARELEEYQKQHPGQIPVWYSEITEGINLRKASLVMTSLRKTNLWEADLQEANLQMADLREAILYGANLQEAEFSETDLRETKLEWANLQKADLSKAKMQKADLRRANLQGTNLLWANLENAILAGANLQEADLMEANLKKAKLREVHLEKVDLYDVESLEGAYFYGAFLDKTRMKMEQLGGGIGEGLDRDYDRAKEAYLLLKNNFNQIGRYDDASWAYVKERQMEKMTYHPKLARKYYAEAEKLPKDASWRSWKWWRFYAKYTLKWLWDWIIWWLCGYGESPGKVVRVAIIVLLAFPLFYWLTGLTPPNGQNILWRDYFLYSLYAFGSMEHPTLQPTSWIAQLFTGLESLSGIALLALLMYTLGRRISRS